MKGKPIPDTIGVSQDTRENLRRASQTMTALELPGYTLTKELGRGNFGTVWQAERTKTKQQVAIKIVDHETGLNWDYFRRELDILIELEEHPNTLTILDAHLENEPPFIVMPLADGGSMEESVRKDAPSLKLIEKWLRQMAEALVFIHRKGVIHCDLKPSNVLLSSAKNVRIADLGQARRLGTGMALGTIGFMAPEQCEEKRRTTPSVCWDVYGFGATAYWLLTGRVPRVEEGKSSSLAEYLENFENRPLVPIRQLNPKIDQELAAIVEGCLTMDAGKRIPSMDAVLSDLDRRQNNQPLLCRQPWGVFYLTLTALKRRTVQVLLLAVTLGVVAGWFAWQERNRNRYLTHRTTGIHAHESGRLEQAYLHWLESLRYDPSNSSLKARLRFMPLAQIYPHKARVTDLKLTNSDRTLISSSTDGEVLVWDAPSGERLGSFPHPSYVSKLAVSPDEKWLATASWDGKARVFSLATGQQTVLAGQGKGEPEPSVTSLKFCDNGRFLVAANLSGQMKIWATETGEPHIMKDDPSGLYILHLAAHPTRPVLAASTGSNTIVLWDLTSGEPLPSEFAHAAEINDLKFSADGRFLVSASDDSTAALWDLESGQRIRAFEHDSRVNEILVLSDHEIVTGCEDGSVNVWDLNQEDPLFEFYHRRPITSLQANPDRTLLAVGTGERDYLWSDTEANGTLRIWDLRTGHQVGDSWPHDGPVEVVAFSKAGDLILSACGSPRQSTAAHPGSVRAWKYILADVESEIPAPGPTPEKLKEVVLSNGVTVSHGQNVDINQFATSAIAELVATASDDRTVRLWSSLTGQQAQDPLLLSGPAKAVCFTADGEYLATAAKASDTYSTVQLWEVETSYPITPTLSCPGDVRTLTFSPDGAKLQAVSDQGTFSWNVENQTPANGWADELHHRLRAKLDNRGSVVPVEEMSEIVMTEERQ
jgi:WD40 repeat protein